MKSIAKRYSLLLLGVALALLGLTAACGGEAPLSPGETPVEEQVISALDTATLLAHAGEIGIVEGVVVRTYYAQSSTGQPTFLDFHDPYEGYFTAVIWGDDRDKFPPEPETYYLNKSVRIKGLIETYQGTPEIILTDPAQIWVVEYDEAVVTQVIDGDTIEIGGGERVRYIGIDTPEVGEPYCQEAAEANRNLVEGKRVRLEKDVEDKDEYGRLLRYVWVDTTMVNAELVRSGYAYSYSYRPNIRYQEYILEVEKEAREQQRGLWGLSP
jgi:micrococcal nuclease